MNLSVTEFIFTAAISELRALCSISYLMIPYTDGIYFHHETWFRIKPESFFCQPEISYFKDAFWCFHLSSGQFRYTQQISPFISNIEWSTQCHKGKIKLIWSGHWFIERWNSLIGIVLVSAPNSYCLPYKTRKWYIYMIYQVSNSISGNFFTTSPMIPE